MKSLLEIILIIMITREDCLDKDGLLGLGFTEAEIFDAPNKEVDSDVCKKLFEEAGSCVDVAKLKVIMEARREEHDTNFEGDDNVIDGIDDAIEAVEDELGDNDTQVDELEKIREKARDGSNKCRNNINKV